MKINNQNLEINNTQIFFYSSLSILFFYLDFITYIHLLFSYIPCLLYPNLRCHYQDKKLPKNLSRLLFCKKEKPISKKSSYSSYTRLFESFPPRNDSFSNPSSFLNNSATKFRTHNIKRHANCISNNKQIIRGQHKWIGILHAVELICTAGVCIIPLAINTSALH